jgi:hypothetical protein
VPDEWVFSRSVQREYYYRPEKIKKLNNVDRWTHSLVPTTTDKNVSKVHDASIFRTTSGMEMKAAGSHVTSSAYRSTQRYDRKINTDNSTSVRTANLTYLITSLLQWLHCDGVTHVWKIYSFMFQGNKPLVFFLLRIRSSENDILKSIACHKRSVNQPLFHSYRP